MPGLESGFYDAEHMTEAVRTAGARLVDRLERVEQHQGNLTLIFVTDNEAEVIKRAMVVERDDPIARVLYDEMEAILQGEGRPSGS